MKGNPPNDTLPAGIATDNQADIVISRSPIHSTWIIRNLNLGLFTDAVHWVPSNCVQLPTHDLSRTRSAERTSAAELLHYSSIEAWRTSLAITWTRRTQSKCSCVSRLHRYRLPTPWQQQSMGTLSCTTTTDGVDAVKWRRCRRETPFSTTQAVSVLLYSLSLSLSLCVCVCMRVCAQCWVSRLHI